MRWWIELQTLGPGRLALASLGLRVSVMAMTFAAPTVVTGYFVVTPMLAERNALIVDQRQLTQQWQTARRDVADQRAVMAATRDETTALLRHWQDDLEETMSAVVTSSLMGDRLTATADTDWVQWQQWVGALNAQSDAAVRLLKLEIKAADTKPETQIETDVETLSPVLRVTLTLTAVPQPSMERSPWPTHALARNPFAEADRAVALTIPEDPLAQLPLAELTIAGVVRRQGQWEVLVTARDMALQRRGLGALLGADGGVIAGIDHRSIVLHGHADQGSSQVELPVRQEGVGDAWVRPVRRSER